MHGLIEPPGRNTEYDFRPFNVQPSRIRDGVNVCPHYQMLLEGSMLLGNDKEVTENYEEFCGQKTVETTEEGAMEPESVEITAYTFCDFVFRGLCGCINNVKYALEIRKSNPYTNANPADVPKSHGRRANLGENSLSAWAAFLGSFEGRSRTPEEILDYVEKLKDRIEQEACGKMMPFGEFATEESNHEITGCKQRPASPGFYGIKY